MYIIILIFFALFTKHFIFDFLLQTEYQFLNKGKYGHPGGLLHAFLAGFGTFISLISIPYILHLPTGSNWIPKLFFICFIEMVIHYHIDWAKIKLNDKLNLTPVNGHGFWWLLGLDQYLHYLTYILIVCYI